MCLVRTVGSNNDFFFVIDRKQKSLIPETKRCFVNQVIILLSVDLCITERISSNQSHIVDTCSLEYETENMKCINVADRQITHDVEQDELFLTYSNCSNYDLSERAVTSVKVDEEQNKIGVVGKRNNASASAAHPCKQMDTVNHSNRKKPKLLTAMNW